MVNDRKLLSIIVPCYNESGVLADFHSEMQEQMRRLDCKYDYEIIYVNDGIVSFNIQPLRLCVYLGGALLVLSMAYLIYLFVNIMMNGIDVPGYFTTIALISIIGGVQLISLGIIGEYVGRIYAEVKNRPAYIVAATNINAGTEQSGLASGAASEGGPGNED